MTSGDPIDSGAARVPASASVPPFERLSVVVVLGRVIGSFVLFVVTLWVGAYVSVIGLLNGCNASPDGESGPYVGVAAALCETNRLSSTLATYAVYLVPAALLLAAQVAYWKRRWGATTLLTGATIVPGVLFAVVPHLSG
ncbi:MAG: hypothetical protein Q7T55_10605 [Solirubrobacteraceae bacterium]|nr:hypothetical protein [Solirubrobacteraceae bacterium]